MTNKVTAVGIVYNRTSVDNIGVDTKIHIRADYEDERNKEWAYYTPALNITMHVKNSVADQFPLGRKLLITFEDQPE